MQKDNGLPRARAFNLDVERQPIGLDFGHGRERDDTAYAAHGTFGTAQKVD